ncbi:MAG: hypothetical protein HDKAJFGB_03954 [Anaerolineae bacterium]|nr:hypothetical protein [Anaerolineae bacterium]RIK29638.1 MAG: hypothetical protein DCC52_07120 [Chloroflexota bacterium]
MQKHTVVIRRFALGPLAQWGFIAGAIVACLPAFVCSWGLFTLAQGVRGLLYSWRDVGFEILGQRLSFNLLEMLKLENFSQTLTGITGLGLFGIVILALIFALALGVFGALVLLLLGAFYNTTGRLQVEVEPAENNAPTF